jgi:hypothetical protein
LGEDETIRVNADWLRSGLAVGSAKLEPNRLLAAEIQLGHAGKRSGMTGFGAAHVPEALQLFRLLFAALASSDEKHRANKKRLADKIQPHRDWKGVIAFREARPAEKPRPTDKTEQE